LERGLFGTPTALIWKARGFFGNGKTREGKGKPTGPNLEGQGGFIGKIAENLGRKGTQTA